MKSKKVFLFLVPFLIWSVLQISCTSSTSKKEKVGESKISDTTALFKANNIEEHFLYTRAFDMITWGIPLVNTDAMRQAFFRDLNAQYNDVCYLSKPANSKLQVTTPNASTHYIMAFYNLKNGPVVIEVPAPNGAGLLGSFLNAWDAPLTDFGPAGDDKGKGGKFLLIPPGYKGKIPSDYLAVPSNTINGYIFSRVILKGDDQKSTDDAIALIKKIRMYTLTQASNPPLQKYIDMYDKSLNGIAEMDDTFFESLNRMVQEEPIQSYDLSIMGMLQSIGIEKGKPFKPSDNNRRIFKAAARDAVDLFISWQRNYAQFYWSDRYWTLPDVSGAKTGWSYVYPDKIDIDGRAKLNFLAFALPKKTGEANTNVYVFAPKDANGNHFYGEKTYVLHIPANVPVKQYWSLVVYDDHTNAFIKNAPIVSLDSYNKALKKNADGSIDIYIGPKAPAGKEANWIYTASGKSWYPVFRLYGPDKPFFDKTWKLDNIKEFQP